MPAKPPITSDTTAHALQQLGEQIRAHRKALKISATAAAEAASMSRVTLHRIEKGEPAVTMGAYLNAIAALGLRMGLLGLPDSNEAASPTPEQDWIPARVRLDDYPQLRQLAWHVQGTDAVSPLQAWQIYERNWRHLDEQAIAPAEQRLIDALRVAMAGAGSTDDV